MKVIVVGAGVFGTWTGLSLAKAGHRVTLLDQLGPGNELSSSAGESRIIRSAYGSDEVYTVMAQRSLRLWTDFFDGEEQRDCFRDTGVLWMAPAGQESICQAHAIFERLAIRHEWLDSRAIATRYGQFLVPDNAVALWEPDAGALLAERSIAAVTAAAIVAGVTYEKAQVLRPVLHRSRLRSVGTADGRHWEADCFVFACGSWLPKLFADLARLISPTRQELFFFAVPEGSVEFSLGALPIWIDQTETKIAYGFPDFGNGVKLGFHRLGPPFDPDTPRYAPEDEAIAEAAEYLAGHLPRMRGAQLKAAQVCHYENTLNGDFLVDLHPGTENVWLLGGGSGHGFKHAPAIAEYLVNALEGKGEPEPRFSLVAKTEVSGRVL
jgi:monomeric sarcosine oxidase